MQDFWDLLDEYGFKDLGYMGEKFTCCNGHEEGFTIWERLDSAVATADWLGKFPTTKIFHLECGTFDHKSLVILLEGISKKNRKPWHFEQMRLDEEGCRDVVGSAWGETFPGDPMGKVLQKIHHCQVKLTWWSRVAFGNVV